MNLTKENINKAVDDLSSHYEKEGIEKKDKIRLTLLAEEVLLHFRDHFSENKDFSLVIHKWGTSRVTIRVKGEAFNPFEAEESDDFFLGSELIQNMLDYDQVRTFYYYRRGCNEIVLGTEKAKKHGLPGGAIMFAAILGILAGVLCKYFLPTDFHVTLMNNVTTPLLDVLMNVIIMTTGPLIFISIITGICALDDITALSSLGLKVINRFVIITLLLIGMTSVVCLIFYPNFSVSGDGSFDGYVLFSLLLDLIPQDLVTPFTEGKTIQVVVLAVAAGICILLLGDRIPGIKSLISELNSLIFELMRLVAKAIPLVVFLSIYKSVSSYDFTVIIGIWKIVAADLIAFNIFCALELLYLRIKRNVKTKPFLSKMSSVLMVAFSTASSSLSMIENNKVCREKFGGDVQLCSFWIPLSHAMFSPSVVVPLVTAAFYGAEFSGSSLSVSQFVIMTFLVVQLSIVSPKVPGGIMATFTILISQLGFLPDAVGLLMASNVFVVNANTALGMLVRDVEFVDFSCSINKRPESL